MIPTTTDDLLAEIERHTSAMADSAATLVRVIRTQEVTIATLEAALKESRANDHQGMQWLGQVAEAAGVAGVDMPALVERVAHLRNNAEEMTTEQLLEELEHRLLERRERKGK